MKKIAHRAPFRCRGGTKEKSRFASEKAANKALDTMWRRAIRRGNVGPDGKMPCRAYPCKVCKGWHLTSQKSRETGEDDTMKATNSPHPR